MEMSMGGRGFISITGVLPQCFVLILGLPDGPGVVQNVTLRVKGGGGGRALRAVWGY